MGNQATTGKSSPGSVKSIQLYFTSTYKYIKATIASVLMWLSMVGGLL